ncbi:MAG: hypothetical protein HUK26_08735, partial [Duodenibacillus sp.]|nr:hypothetical protein [Duodenibacillus sp.]
GSVKFEEFCRHEGVPAGQMIAPSKWFGENECVASDLGELRRDLRQARAESAAGKRKPDLLKRQAQRKEAALSEATALLTPAREAEAIWRKAG